MPRFPFSWIPNKGAYGSDTKFPPVAESNNFSHVVPVSKNAYVVSTGPGHGSTDRMIDDLDARTWSTVGKPRTSRTAGPTTGLLPTSAHSATLLGLLAPGAPVDC